MVGGKIVFCGNFSTNFYHFETKTKSEGNKYCCAEKRTDVRKMIDKYEFIQLLILLRDRMICKSDSETVNNLITDLMELDQVRIKEKYPVF